MLTLICDLWKNNKIKTLAIAIPLATLLILSLVFKAQKVWLLDSARKLLEKSMAKDRILSQEIEKISAESDAHRKRAEELKKQAEDTKTEDDADWNKKI